MGLRTFVTVLALLSTTGWAQYVLEDDYMSGGNFFDKFSFWDTPDPTHGFVEYQDYETALNSSLISTSSGSVEMRVADTGNTPNGRPSVRITSTESYQSGLVIVDVAHMPGGVCGTWPAFWMVGPNWPNSGEIDIIEGVNEQSSNLMTLHTGPGCSISSSSGFSGTVDTDNCDVNAAGQGTNQGCSIATSNTQTYGSGFNANGGGVYATEITSTYIAIYFFPRNSIPSDVTNGWPDPSSWGTPVAKFEGSCDIPEKFLNLQIVFDITLCGDWAGEVWSQSSCGSQAATCNAFVANTPDAFTDAYWAINGLKVYQNGGSSPAPSSASSIQASTPFPLSTPFPTSQPVSIVPTASVPTTFVISTSKPWAQPSNTAPDSAAPTSTGPWIPNFTGTEAISNGGSPIAEPTAAASSSAQQGYTPAWSAPISNTWNNNPEPTSSSAPDAFTPAWSAASNNVWNNNPVPTTVTANEHPDPTTTNAWDVGNVGLGARSYQARHLRIHQHGHAHRYF